MNAQTTTTKTTRRAMTAAQVRHYTGKRIDLSKWVVPAGYAVCVVTGVMLPEAELMNSVDYRLHDKIKAALGYGVADADWLSDRGFGIVIAALGCEDYWDYVSLIEKV